MKEKNKTAVIIHLLTTLLRPKIRNKHLKLFGLILAFSIIFLVIIQLKKDSTPLANAQSSGEKLSTNLVPKPADARLAGWNEDLSSVYIAKNFLNTYIFSKVYGYDPDRKSHLGPFGYFRVMSLNTIEFAARTLPPYYGDKRPPIQIVKEGSVTLIVLYMGSNLDGYSLAVYNELGCYTTIFLGLIEPIFEDLDLDGAFETKGYTHLGIPFNGKKFEESPYEYKNIEGMILAVYRYTRYFHDKGEGSYFMRVKGKGFEKYFIEHAKNLIEKKYQEWLERAKSKSFDRETKKQLTRIIEGWLGTVESTQNKELIKDALIQLAELPYPSKEEKQKIIEKLIERGYPGLGIK